MKRILVSLTALIVALSCMFALCACNVPDVLPGQDDDVTLGGGAGDKTDKDTTVDEDEGGDFGTTDSTDGGNDAEVLEPDTVPATPGLEFRLNSDGKSYRVFDYFSNAGETLSADVYIPYTYEGLPVTGIGYGAFDGVEYLASVVLPKTLVSIGDYAFRDCKALTALNLPASLKSIGVSAFDNCNSIARITVEEGNEVYSSISSSLVDKATATIILGSSSSVIPTDGSVTAIGENAFRGKDITSVVIPECVTSIGRGAFADCKYLGAVTLPSTLTTIEESVFIRCSALTSITIPETVTSIGYSAFEGCSKITNVEIPAAVTEIGGRAFKDCTGLLSITLHEGLVTIGGETFSGCEKITDVVLPLSLVRIGTMAFRKCSALRSLTFVPEYVEYDYNATEIYVRIDSKLEEIGNGAFYDCFSLKSIVVPRGAKTIGAYAFYGCSDPDFVVYFEASVQQISWETGWNSGLSGRMFYYSNTAAKNPVWHYVEGADGEYEIEIIPAN